MESALPLIEEWIQRDTRHRTLAMELSKWLAAVALKHGESGSGASSSASGGGGSNTTAAANAAAPTEPMSPSKAAAAVAAASPQRGDPLSRMIGEAESMLNTFGAGRGGGVGVSGGGSSSAAGKGSGLVGGIAPTPPVAKGVPEPTKPIKESGGGGSGGGGGGGQGREVQPQVDDKQKREQFLALQTASHHRARMEKVLSAKDVTAALLHLGRAAEAVEEYLNAAGSMQKGEEARELFDSIIAAIPHKATLSAALEKTLERIMIKSEAAEERGEHDEVPSPTAAVAPLLAGKVAVLIGGDVREDRRDALKSQLGVAELRWIKSTPTNPATKFDAEIKRADVGLVLLAIRWVRHNTAYAVADACTKFKKPLVRLPGGLGSNAVAHEILDQVKGKL